LEKRFNLLSDILHFHLMLCCSLSFCSWGYVECYPGYGHLHNSHPEIVALVAVLKELCCVPDQSTGETGHGSKETFVTLVKNLTVIIEFL